MKNLIKTAVAGGFCILCLEGLTSRAQESGFYIKGDLGGNITQDVNVNEFLGADVSGVKLKLDPGFRAGVAGGYWFTDFLALEGEIGYVANQINSVSGATQVQDAWLMNVPFLANLKLQLPMGRCPIKPYIGAGAGFSETIFDVDHLTIGGISLHGNDSDTVFAWQAFAGLRYAINERMSLAVEYRYLETDSPTWHADVTFNTTSDAFKFGKAHTQAISLAFDYRF